jgi:hypothetical protein
MSIYYAVVARKTTILTKYAQYVGNFDQVSLKHLVYHVGSYSFGKLIC